MSEKGALSVSSPSAGGGSAVARDFEGGSTDEPIVVRLRVAAVLAFCPSPRAMRHHSFSAEFDRDKPIKLTGTITKVEWTNPHARIYIDVQEEDGKVVNWDFELGRRTA